jgi:hypothetical protein
MSLPPLIQSIQLHMESGSSRRRRGLSTCPAIISIYLKIGSVSFVNERCLTIYSLPLGRANLLPYILGMWYRIERNTSIQLTSSDDPKFRDPINTIILLYQQWLPVEYLHHPKPPGASTLDQEQVHLQHKVRVHSSCVLPRLIYLENRG